MSKILITGITPTHINDPNRSPTTKFISAPIILCDALRTMNYEVEFRATIPGEDLSVFERVFLFTYPKAMNEEVLAGFHHASCFTNSVLCFDDWDYVNAIMPVFKMPMLGCWADWGDKRKRGAGFEDAMTWDPGAFMNLSSITSYGNKSRQWLHAAFPMESHEWASRSCKLWPVIRYGAPGMPRIMERNLVLNMQGVSGVLAAPYIHKGAGWWRSRWNYALAAGAVIGAQDGEFPGITTQPKTLESMTTAQLNMLRNMQTDFIAPNYTTQYSRLLELVKEGECQRY